MKEKIMQILSETVERDDITEDMLLGTDVALTSINAMKLIYRLEEELKIKDIPMEIFYEAETVGGLIDAVCKLA